MKLNFAMKNVRNFGIVFFKGHCTKESYKKDDGMCACTFDLGYGKNFLQASDECQRMGGRLPEIRSESENAMIVLQSVRAFQIIGDTFWTILDTPFLFGDTDRDPLPPYGMIFRKILL